MFHHLGPTQDHDRGSPFREPSLEVESGDVVEFDCQDSSGGRVTPQTSLDEYTRIDREGLRPVTGPVFVKGARPGDVLEVRVRRIEHHGWGWTGIDPGLGLLPGRFGGPFLFHWRLEGNESRSMPGVTLPLSPFLGTLGVSPAGDGQPGTWPSGESGGHLDVRQLVPGSTLYLPVFREGAWFSAGDGHAAQGDGEVCHQGIEAPLTAELQLTVRRDLHLSQPLAELPPQQPHGPDLGSWAFIESAEQPMDAVRGAVGRAVDFLVARRRLHPEQAYALCSVALDLRISQCVHASLVTITAALAKSLFR